MKCLNNGGQPSAEGMEGRRPAKENIAQATAPRTQSRTSELSDLSGVRRVAQEEKRTQFTALLHHVTVGLLRDSVYALKRNAAPGVDGVTWKEYETELGPRLADLHIGVCGHCGRKLKTHYRGRNSTPGYHCAGKDIVEGRGLYCLNVSQRPLIVKARQEAPPRSIPVLGSGATDKTLILIIKA